MRTTDATPILLLLVTACTGTSPPSDPALASGKQFVRRFYGWYLTAAERGTGQQVATKDSAALFDAPLVAALRADADAQAKNSQEIVGLDGDPFLDAQDFCKVYEVGDAHHEGNLILVDVRGDCTTPTGKDTLPDVVAVLSRGPSDWVFANFRYPRRDSDLQKDLRALRLARDGKH